VEFGLKDVGYEYVVLDDCWSLPARGKNDQLLPDLKKFPNGMKDVADKIHDLGLKFGMYSSAGTMTCGRYLGSLGYEDIDAKTFAGWGVDYLKVCYKTSASDITSLTMLVR
jgi:alpha-galactosidase